MRCDADRGGGRRDEEECGQHGPSIAFVMAAGGAIVGIDETVALIDDFSVVGIIAMMLIVADQ